MKRIILAATALTLATLVAVAYGQRPATRYGSAEHLSRLEAQKAKFEGAKKAGGAAVDLLRADVIAARDRAEALMTYVRLSENDKAYVREYVNHPENLAAMPAHTVAADRMIASKEVRDWVEKEVVYQWETKGGQKR